MKTYNASQARKYIKDNIELSDTDNEGQIIVYTGLYTWSDGTIRDYPEGEVEDVIKCEFCGADTHMVGYAPNGLCGECGGENE